MRRYQDLIYGMSPTVMGAGRVKDIVAALTPPTKPAGGTTALVKVEPKPAVKDVALALAPGAIGAFAGAMYFRKSHWVLGALGGHALGSVAYPLIKGTDRKRALGQLAIEASAIAGALCFGKKSNTKAVIGWIGGGLAGAAVTSFVSGTNAYDFRTKLMSKK